MGIRYAASSGRATPTRVSFVYHEEKRPRAPGRHAEPNTYVPEARRISRPPGRLIINGGGPVRGQKAGKPVDKPMDRPVDNT